MVQHSSKGHEKQEQDDPLAEYVAGGAEEEGKTVVNPAQMTPISPPKYSCFQTHGFKL